MIKGVRSGHLLNGFNKVNQCYFIKTIYVWIGEKMDKKMIDWINNYLKKLEQEGKKVINKLDSN